MNYRTGSIKVELDPDDYAPADILRVTRIASEFLSINQILGTDVEEIHVVQSGPAAAWTKLSGDVITFNLAKMPLPNLLADISVWLGTNAHELAHNKFTPRDDSPLMQRLIESDRLYLPGILRVHNITEDQRAERFLLGEYYPWRFHLVAALGYHLKLEARNSWFLTTGRTWLSDYVRNETRKAFVIDHNESTAREVTYLVGQYQRLTDPGEDQADYAWEILEQLHNVFDLDTPPGGCGGGRISDNQSPDTEPNDESAPPPADEADDTGAQTDGEESNDGEDQSNDPGDQMGSTGKETGDEHDPDGDGNQSNDSGDDANEDGDGDESSDGTGESEDGEDQSNDPGDQTGAGAGKGDTPGKSFDPDKIRERMRQDAQDGLNSDPKSKSDTDSIMDVVNNGRPDASEVEGTEAEGEYQTATEAAQRLRRQVSESLVEFKTESEPGWERRTAAGRLNVRRFYTPNSDPRGWFDRFSPDQMDATELEAVVLLDVSNSMSNETLRLSEAAWAIHHAVDDIEGVITLLTFSAGMRVVSSPGQLADSRMFRLRHHGGTDPESALTFAFHRLASSQMTNRLLVILTDGEWVGNSMMAYWNNESKTADHSEQTIAAMRAAGITTMLAYLPTNDEVGGQSAGDPHGCEYFRVIKEPGDLAIMFRDVALAQMKRLV